MTYTYTDLRADAEREGDDRVRAAEEVPERVWVHAAALPWTRVA